jgi:hypothetical protein
MVDGHQGAKTFDIPAIDAIDETDDRCDCR